MRLAHYGLWRTNSRGPALTPRYKDTTTLPASTVMRSRGSVLLLAVLPLPLPLCLVAARVAMLAKKRCMGWVQRKPRPPVTR